MKNKFLIMSLLVGSFFTACSSDDDGGDKADPIIGSWYYSGAKEDGEIFNSDSDCDKQSITTYNADGSYAGINYFDSDGECGLDIEFSGTWENKGDGVYTATDEDGTEDMIIEFSNNNNTFFWEDEGTNGMDGEFYTRVGK